MFKGTMTKWFEKFESLKTLVKIDDCIENKK